MADNKTIAKTRKRNAAGTKERLMRAAMHEFGAKGYGGARIATIVKRAGCNIRMVYHYFGGKEALYLACLERVYSHIREEEAKLELNEQEPLEAVRELAGFTYDHMRNNPDFVRMAGVENTQQGRLIRKLPQLASAAENHISRLARILENGERRGLIRPGIDAFQLYVSILALSYLHLSNRHTLATTYERDLTDRDWLDQRREHVCDLVGSYLRTDAAGPA